MPTSCAKHSDSVSSQAKYAMVPPLPGAKVTVQIVLRICQAYLAQTRLCFANAKIVSWRLPVQPGRCNPQAIG